MSVSERPPIRIVIPADAVPKGSGGHWKNLSPVRKSWAIYEHD